MGILDYLSDAFSGNPSTTPADGSTAAAQSPSISDNLAGFMGAGNNSMYTPQQRGAAAQNALLNMGIAMMKASAPSMDPAHRNFGYAVANGLEGAQQGYQGSLQNATQNQANAYKLAQMRMQMQYANGLMGGGSASAPAQAPTQPAPAPSAPPNPAMLGGGLGSAALGGAPSLGSPGGGVASGASAQPAADSVTKAAVSGAAGIPPSVANGTSDGVIPGLSRQQSAMLYMNDQATYWKTMASAHSPTDIQKQAAATYGENTPEYQAYMQSYLDKQNTMALRPGGAYKDQTGVHYVNPAAPAGFTYDQNGTMVPVQGGLDAIRQSEAAKAAGKNDQTIAPTQYDQNGNPLPTMSTSQALGAPGQFQLPGQAQPQGQVPPGIRNNNPGNIKGANGFNQYPDMATGMQAVYDNLGAYGTKHGINTISGAITRWAPPSDNNDTNAYIQDVAQRTGLAPNQKIDLTNPAVQHLLGSAIVAHENGAYAPQMSQVPPSVQSFPNAPGSKPVSGATYSAPPQGVTSGANSASTGLSDTMNKQYGDLAKSDQNYQMGLSNLAQMRQISQNQNLVGRVGAMLPDDVGALANPNQAIYQKLRASTLANMAPGGTGTDASRATVEASLPDYDKPQSAQLAGIDNAQNQLMLQHVKRQFLTPIYQSKDANAFTQQSSAFDQNVTPTMARALTIPDPNQRKAAIQSMIAQNPAYKPGFQWALTNGLLK